MNPNLNSNSSNNFSGGNINGYGNTITNNVDQSRKEHGHVWIIPHNVKLMSSNQTTR